MSWDSEIAQAYVGQNNYYQQPLAAPAKKMANLGKSRGTGNVLSWDDVSSVINFIETVRGWAQEDVDVFVAVFGINNSEDYLDIAQALYPSGWELQSFKLLSEIADASASGVVSYTDGLSLVNKLDAHGEILKTLARQVTFISGNEIKHRKNVQTTEFLGNILEALSNSSNDISGLISKFKTAFAIWPGEKSK